MKKTKKKKKNALKDNFYLGKGSVYTICVSFFISSVVIGVCFTSEFFMERYARINVAQAETLLAKVYVRDYSENRIFIGEGVSLSERCKVSETEITCY